MPDQIVVRGLRKQFPKVVAVAGVDLDVATGEVFGLLGPNGAGKTTTLEMIEGLTRPDAGEISIRGLNWNQHAEEIRSIIGVQLQATSLYNKITPREALDLFGGYYPKREEVPYGTLISQPLPDSVTAQPPANDAASPDALARIEQRLDAIAGAVERVQRRLDALDMTLMRFMNR